jgi:hypothetical protein
MSRSGLGSPQPQRCLAGRTRRGLRRGTRFPRGRLSAVSRLEAACRTTIEHQRKTGSREKDRRIAPACLIWLARRSTTRLSGIPWIVFTRRGGSLSRKQYAGIELSSLRATRFIAPSRRREAPIAPTISRWSRVSEAAVSRRRGFNRLLIRFLAQRTSKPHFRPSLGVGE